MQVQEMVLDKENAETATNTHFTPAAKLSRNDVSFPLTTPRRRAPSTASLADLLEPDGKSVGRLTIRARSIPSPGEDKQLQESLTEQPEPSDPPRATFFDLPLEVQNKVIDFIFGDIHSVTGNNHSLRGKNVSSLMRHPRRKAVSDFALVTKEWRVLVQERIFRHIKVKGTRAGLQECEEFFASNMTLAGYVRHIEVWVPVWGDKGSPAIDEPFYVLRNGGPRHLNYPLANQPDEMAADPLGLTFRMAAQTATLSEIFEHISIFFDKAKVFTLEGGHCKKSNMIRHFPRLLFNVSRAQQLKKLSNIRTFAMRGSWNIMRSHRDWLNIQDALPNVEEWHCGYAKPRPEAEVTIHEILHQPPPKWRSVNICLDGMYSKDTILSGSSSGLAALKEMHLCARLGTMLPQLDNLSYTGKVCECFWKSALASLQKNGSRGECRLRSLELVVKSCCRKRVTTVDTVTGEEVEEELGGVMADGAGISNLVFIKAFERLILSTVEALKWAASLEYVRVRYIDLDSECTHLNPYWILDRNHVWGIWSEEIVEALNQSRPTATYVELGDGIDLGGKVTRNSDDGGRDTSWPNVSNTTAGAPNYNGAAYGAVIPQSNVNSGIERSVTSMYPRLKPKSIKTSSYRVLAEARSN
jgi:hypothetical protein